MRVDKAEEAVQIARRVIDLVYARVATKISSASDEVRDGSDGAAERYAAYDNGFNDARDACSVTIGELDVFDIVKAVYPNDQ